MDGELWDHRDLQAVQERVWNPGKHQVNVHVDT